ncbi:hypothetical protein GCM10009533_62880 [Saccharopolyspora spinosporotrichia]
MDPKVSAAAAVQLHAEPLDEVGRVRRMGVLRSAARMFGLVAPEAGRRPGNDPAAEEPPRAGDAPEAPGSRTDAERILELTNQARSEAGLPPLRISDALNRAAAAHSADMAARDFVSHTGSDGSDPVDRAKAAGYVLAELAENLSAGTGDAESTFRQWMRSPEHSGNILDAGFTELGAGHAQGDGTRFTHYWTQVLARPS